MHICIYYLYILCVCCVVILSAPAHCYTVSFICLAVFDIYRVFQKECPNFIWPYFLGQLIISIHYCISR